MAYDLTLTSATFADTAGGGKAINGGYGHVLLADAPPWSTFDSGITIDARAKTSDTTSAAAVIVGSSGSFWFAKASGSNYATARWGSPEQTISTTKVITDGVEHHFRLCIDDTGNVARFFIDGVLAGQSVTASAMAKTTGFAVRTFNNGTGGTPTTSFPWRGEIAEVAIWNSVKSTADFTPAAISPSDPGLVVLWKLDGDGLNSAGAAPSGATAVTLSGPSGGVAGTASTNFTIGADGAITGTVTVTPSDGGAGGTFSPASVAISAGTPTATFTYTPASTGAKTISVTNDGGLTNPSSVTYTATAAPVVAVTLTGPTSGTVGVASANFTVGASDTLAGSVVVTPSDGGAGGTFTPATVTISAGAPTATFTYAAASIGAKTISVTNDGGLTNPASITYTAAAPAVNNAYNKDAIVWSPYNWNVQSAFAAAVNAGAYFRTEFGGSACDLVFDVAGLSAPVPKVLYKIDGQGPWNEADVASLVTLTMPASTTGFPNHLLEVMVKATSGATNRWNGTSNIVKLTGINLQASKTLTKPEQLPLNALFYGDSITEGLSNVGDSGDFTVKSNAAFSWSMEAARILGAEIGNVGFSGQGVGDLGDGSVPIFTSTYNYIYSGVPRTFSPQPDFIVINHGTNDGTSNITTAYTAVLDALLAATSTAVIFAMRPFNGAAQAANIQAAIAACSNPSRVVYVDTAGWFSTANSFDTLHPNAFEDVSNLGPRIANVIRPVVHPVRGQRTARTVTLNMVTSGATPVASVSGLKWAFFDNATPDQLGIAACQGVGEVTDASGVLTITVNTTLPSGGVGWLVVTDSDGTTTQTPAHRAFSGPVEVT